MSAHTQVAVGDSAPDFTLPDAQGKNVTLSNFQGKSSIVLYFYPKDNTPGCTTEACAFRDNYEVFQTEGAEVIGVSSDSESSHQEFAGKQRLPFILLSDKNGTTRKLYGVPASLGLIPGRVTYVIDKKGVVRHIFNSQTNPLKHIEESLTVLRKINAE